MYTLSSAKGTSIITILGESKLRAELDSDVPVGTDESVGTLVVSGSAVESFGDLVGWDTSVDVQNPGVGMPHADHRAGLVTL